MKTMKSHINNKVIFKVIARFLLISSVSSLFGPVLAQPSGSSKADASELASKLTNPVADLVSVPFQFNYDATVGNDRKGSNSTLVFQPVVPVKLGSDWTYILRPVITLESQNSVNGYTGSGATPAVIETFFSPKSSGNFIWGVGPMASTAALSGRPFGTAQSGVGVAAVGLFMKAPWTVGLLTYNSWATGGDASFGTANNFYYQPFMSYVTQNAWTYSLNTQSTYNWDAKKSQNPMNATISKLVKFGDTPVSLMAGVRYYLNSMPGGPSGWGFRAGITFMLPE